MDEDILFERRGAVGLATLNRPSHFNALTGDMARALDAQLQTWAQDDAVSVVAVRGAGERAFCAGGDIRDLYERIKSGDPAQIAEAHRFFADEYRLNAAIKAFAKPYIAFMDGIVMGGGVGVSIHGRYRVGGDRTLFAMPECGIGFFPDVGASFFLPRMPRRFGLYAGLSGARFEIGDCIFAHVVDYYVRSEQTETVLAELAAADYSDNADETVCEVLAVNSSAPPPGALKAHAGEIEEIFALDTLGESLDALEIGSDWARAQAAGLRGKSPFALALTHRMLAEGAGRSFNDCLELEYRLACAVSVRPDFVEGVRAAVIDKDHAPKWSPATLEEVDAAEIERMLQGDGAPGLGL